MASESSTSIHRITLLYAGRSQEQVNEIVSALCARAREHGGFVGMFVADDVLSLDDDETDDDGTAG